MKNQIMKMKLIVAAALILSYSCKTVIQENIWSRSNNQINFIWESVEINGKLKEKAAMSVPFRIEDIPYNFKCQFDLGSYNSWIYENSFKPIKELYPSYRNSISNTEDLTEIKLSTTEIGSYKVLNHKYLLYKDFGDKYSIEDFESTDAKNVCTIGSDIFAEKYLLIDYPNNKLQVHEYLPNIDSNNFVFTPINFDAGFIKVSLQIDGKLKQFMFDTGSSLFALIVSPEDWKNYKIESSPIDTLTISSWGNSYDIYGSQINPTVSINELKLSTTGQLVYSNHFYKDFFKSEKIAGLIGNAFFIDRRVIIDYKNMLLGVERNTSDNIKRAIRHE